MFFFSLFVFPFAPCRMSVPSAGALSTHLCILLIQPYVKLAAEKPRPGSGPVESVISRAGPSWSVRS